MKIRKYLVCLLKDFLKAYGCLMVAVSFYLAINSVRTIKASLLWQIMLIASAYGLYKSAFVNEHETGKRTQLISFTIFSTLADLLIVLWLFLFSPGKIADKNMIIASLAAIIIVKAAVYAMSYVDGQHQAKQLNEELRRYKNAGSE